MRLLSIVLILGAFSLGVHAQQTVSVLATASPQTGAETRQGYIGIGVEARFENILPRFDVIQRFTINKEYKQYQPEDLEGTSQRYTALTRFRVGTWNKTSVFATPLAVNLRRVSYSSVYGYKKRGYNLGVGGGIVHQFNKQARVDASVTYFFPDLHKWEHSTGTALGNSSRGFVFETNGYFKSNPGSKLEYGYMVQVNHFKSIQPYDPEPRPFYSSNSVVAGFRFGRKFHER